MTFESGSVWKVGMIDYPIEAVPGDDVVFLGEGASEFEVEEASKHIQVGDVHRVDKVFADKWGYHLYLVGIENKSFKGTMFERI